MNLDLASTLWDSVLFGRSSNVPYLAELYPPSGTDGTGHGGVGGRDSICPRRVCQHLLAVNAHSSRTRKLGLRGIMKFLLENNLNWGKGQDFDGKSEDAMLFAARWALHNAKENKTTMLLGRSEDGAYVV
ncbi:NDH dependent flow 6 [Striga asiatica]|uniref:NDH dependent flow 6 n=1 Tax=Striga asiatica TaxID=4170 RepID=A0A5A7Q7K5_STRAF|nr:NDH dependent flow 6 [Striga asiatica]